MPIILACVDFVFAIGLVIAAAKVKTDLERSRNARLRAESYAEKLEKLYGEVAILPDTLPKTYPDNAYPLRQLPPDLQAAIGTDVREKRRNSVLPPALPLREDLALDDDE